MLSARHTKQLPEKANISIYTSREKLRKQIWNEILELIRKEERVEDEYGQLSFLQKTGETVSTLEISKGGYQVALSPEHFNKARDLVEKILKENKIKVMRRETDDFNIHYHEIDEDKDPTDLGLWK